MAEGHLRKIRDLFERYDTDKDDSLDLNELALMLQEISSKITPLPAVCHFVSHVYCYFVYPSHAFDIDCAGRLSTRQISRQEAQQARQTAGYPRCA